MTKASPNPATMPTKAEAIETSSAICCHRALSSPPIAPGIIAGGMIPQSKTPRMMNAIPIVAVFFIHFFFRSATDKNMRMKTATVTNEYIAQFGIFIAKFNDIYQMCRTVVNG